MKNDSEPEVYLIHVWIRRIHPMLWRRMFGNSAVPEIGARTFKCKIVVLGRADTIPNWKMYVDAKLPLDPLLMLVRAFRGCKPKPENLR
jgi:hypothetical protein